MYSFNTQWVVFYFFNMIIDLERACRVRLRRRITGERSDKACLSNPANPNEQDRISRFVNSDSRWQLKRLQPRFQTL
jgi:hypothetical protein